MSDPAAPPPLSSQATRSGDTSGPDTGARLGTLCIHRPVATALLMLALVLGGLLGWRLMPFSALPQVDYPTIEVQTLYPGASGDVMSRVVTAPLERSLGQISGLQRMHASSAAGVSVITLQFTLGLPLDVAEQEVQAALNAASTLLPADLPTPPVYAKVNPADAPIMTLALHAPTLALTQVQDIVNTRLAPKISQIEGVGRVVLGGGQRPALRIQVDPQALAARGIGLDTVRAVIAAANTSGATGSLDGPKRAYSLQANSQIQSVEAAAQLIVGRHEGAVVRLADVAQVIHGPENRALAAWVGQGCGHPDRPCAGTAPTAVSETALTPAIVLNVQRQPGANVVRTADALRAALPYWQAQLPAGVELTVLNDRTTNIRASVHHVQWELALAVVMVVLVIFAFLRSWAATAIAALAVPVALIGTLSVSYLLGYSVNNLSLMALTIAAGFVVDDVIVVLENTARHLEAGLRPMAAALAGVRQIGFTIVSLTVSLVAVLIPLLFMGDVVGRLFREFAVTLAVSIGLSALVALTLVPMLCARWLRAPASPSRATPPPDWRQRLHEAYGRRLAHVLAHPAPTLLGLLGTLVLTVCLYGVMPKGLFPVQDTGLLQARVMAAADVSFDRMQALQLEVARALLADPDVATLSTVVGADGANNLHLNTARVLLTLRPGHAAQDEVIHRLRERVAQIPGARLFAHAVQDLTLETEASANTHRVVLEGAHTAAVNDGAQQLAQALQAFPQTVQQVHTDAGTTTPAVSIQIDRDTAARLGITANTVDELLYNAFGQRVISTLLTPTDQIRIVLEAQTGAFNTPSRLAHLPLKSTGPVSRPSDQTPASRPADSAALTTLGSVATITETTTPLHITRIGQFPAAIVGFETAPGVALDQAVKTVRDTAQTLGLPPEITLHFLGAAGTFEDTLIQQRWLLLAAVVCVYIVLGVLYESTIHPLTILSTLPSAGVGALLMLWLSGQDLNIIGVIGLILLIGIVKKNAIMMVDFALDAQRQLGLSPAAAIHRAALMRLRPILMTTAAALMAALPLMLGGGPGSELRLPLGLAIFGGLLLSQWLTLFTTPVLYLSMDKLGQGCKRLMGP